MPVMVLFPLVPAMATPGRPAFTTSASSAGRATRSHAERARRAHLRRLRLHRGGVDEAVEAGRHRGSVLGQERDAQPAQEGGEIAALALIQRAVGALHRMAARPHEPREGIHARAGDAGEVVA